MIRKPHWFGALLGTVSVLSVAGLMGCGVRVDEERLHAWLTCDECVDGELAFVTDSIGRPARGPLREVLLGDLSGALASSRAVALAEFRATPGMVGDTSAFVDAVAGNVVATMQTRAAVALGALGDTMGLRLAAEREQATPGTYRTDVVTAIDEARVASGAAGFAPSAPAAVRLRPDTLRLEEGTTGGLEALVQDAAGRYVTRSLVWASANPTVATVSSPPGVPARGDLTALAAGTTLVTATASAGLAGSAVVIVEPPRPDPDQLRIVAGDGRVDVVGTPLDVPLRVRLTDPNGVPLPGVVVTWSWEQAGIAGGPVISSTDGAGHASLPLTLGPTPGRVFVTATVPGARPVRFQLRAVS